MHQPANSTLARLAVLVVAVCCVVEARIHLWDPHSGHKSAQKTTSTLGDLKGRLMLPLRSEAGKYGDSNTYFVQLPPNQNYYSQLTSHVPFTPGTTHLRRLLPVNFASNGRPSRVYHWNVPLLRRMQQQQQLQARRHSPADDLITPVPALASKSRRVTKKANAKKTSESPIYNIMRFEKHQDSIKSHKARVQNIH